ncbi:hypothetical protein VNO78_28490 [Psophocarpus tetragonolobus]|uniref:Uncharacterized protein n=1 Tax=Psophocarpus tetragonolobus TaxID=3891 RepID=A0AAN9XBA6_PSOTE
MEVGKPTLRHQLCNNDNEEEMLVDLNLAQELKDKVTIREETSKRRAIRKYNTKVKPRLFLRCCLTGVLKQRLIQDAIKVGSMEKLKDLANSSIALVEALLANTHFTNKAGDLRAKLKVEEDNCRSAE